MSSLPYLREFIKDRLTAACEEIFSEVQRTVVQYEEEIDRQRRLLDISRKPDTHSHITGLPQQHDCEEEEGLDEQQVCDQERNSSLDQEDPEPPQIEEAQEELCSSQEGEQLGLKQQSADLIVWTDEERLRLLKTIWKPEIMLHRIDLPQQHDCEEEEGLDEQQVCDQERNSSPDQEDPEPPQIKEAQEELCSSQEGEQLGLKQESEDLIVCTDEERLRMLKTKPEIMLHRIDDVCQEEEVLTEQQVCNQERNSSLDQEDPEPPQITKEKEELCSSQDGEQLGLKQEADAFRVTLTYENSNHSKAEPNSEQLLSHSSAEAESRDLEESQHVDSGSTRNAELKKRRPHSKRAVNTPVSESQRQADKRKKSAHCDTCGKTFSDKSELKTHLRIHTGEKPHCCKTCGKRFNFKSHLEHHIRTHTGEKPCACSTCGKRFIHKSNLERHIRTHTGEKPYACNTCEKRFSLNCSLERHVRTHTGEKPYACNTCEKRFTQTSKLQRHMRSHTGEKSHCCTTCGKRFKEKSDLERHIRTHTGKKPYCCEICEKRFRQSAHLKKHMRVHAGSEFHA